MPEINSTILFGSLAKMQVELSLPHKREVDIADLSKEEGLFFHQIMTMCERIKFNHDESRGLSMEKAARAHVFKYFFTNKIPYSTRE